MWAMRSWKTDVTWRRLGFDFELYSQDCLGRWLVKKIFCMFFWLALFGTTTSCGDKNLFTDAAKKDTDAALAEDARKLNSTGDFDGAIAKFGLMSTGFRTSNEMTKLLASAYAGKCGFNFLNFFEAIKDSSSDSLFMLTMRAFKDVAVDPSSCTQAQATIQTLVPDPNDSDRQLFMALLGFAKMGTYLRARVDVDQDGNVDDVANACKETILANNDVREVFTGLGLVLDNLASLAAVASGGDTAEKMAELKTKCTENGVNCAFTNPNDIDDNAVLALRTLIDTQEFGVGDCIDDPFVTCCP